MTSKHPESKVENPVNGNAAEPNLDHNKQEEQAAIEQQSAESDNTKQQNTENKTDSSQTKSSEPIDYVILGKKAFLYTVTFIWILLFLISFIYYKKTPPNTYTDTFTFKIFLTSFSSFLTTLIFDGIFRIIYRRILIILKANTSKNINLLPIILLLPCAIAISGIATIGIVLFVFISWGLGQFPSSVTGLTNHENLIIVALSGLAGSYFVDLIVDSLSKKKTKTKKRLNPNRQS